MLKNQKKTDLKPIRDALDKHRVLCSFHELYGVLCGMLTVDMLTEFVRWTAEMGKLGVDRRCFDGAAAGVWRSVFADAAAQLSDGDLHFRPLPYAGAEQDYGLRMRALTDWCNGFTYGAGVADPQFETGLSASSRKFLADLGEISSADCGELSGDEQLANEAAYECVVEYLGVGVVMMCDEIVTRKANRRLH